MGMNTGGPAFPHVADLVQHSPNGGITTKPITSNGMTLRDYFAAKAMQGLIASANHKGLYAPPDNELASAAFQLADAMLKARQA
jgi:hypothetical protein